MSNENNLGSGDGTRPTTDGGVDNIGGASTFTPGKGSANAPKPAEKMSENKKDKASVRNDDSSAFDLKESTDTTPNTEPGRPPLKPG
jgi:hypothetical protein